MHCTAVNCGENIPVQTASFPEGNHYRTATTSQCWLKSRKTKEFFKENEPNYDFTYIVLYHDVVGVVQSTF